MPPASKKPCASASTGSSAKPSDNGGDDRRIARQHRFDADLRRRLRQIVEQVLGAADAQRIADHLASADGVQRPVPDLVEHLQRLVPPVALGQAPHAFAEPGRQPLAGLGLAQCLAQRSQLPSQFVEVVRFGDEEGDAEIAQALQLRLGHAARPDQDQIGLQLEQAFEVDLAVAADGRQVPDRRRPFAAVQHADQAVRGAEFEHAIGQRRRQADHPLRRPGGKAEEQAGEQPERTHQPS